MNHTTKAALAAITIASLPAVSLASRLDSKAAHACAEAFVAGLATPAKPAPKLKAANFYNIDDLLGAPSEIALTAVDPHSGLTVARASCELSASGKVLAIRAVPL